jgi:hypothetical protein
LARQKLQYKQLTKANQSERTENCNVIDRNATFPTRITHSSAGIKALKIKKEYVFSNADKFDYL